MKVVYTTFYRYITLVIFSLLISSILVSCLEEKKEEIAAEDTNESAIKTLVVPVTNQKLTPNLQSFGTISVKKSLEVTTAVEGIVNEVFVEESDQVEKDQVLMKIRDIQLEIAQKKAETNFKSALANLELKKMEYEDSKLSIESKFIRLIQQEQQLEIQKQELENFEKKLIQQRKIFELNGITKGEMDDLELNYKKLETEYNNALLSYESARIGYRDSDLKRNGIRVPTDQEKKKQKLILLNTRAEKAQVTFAQANVSVVKAELESMNLLVEQLTIKAPINGTVINKSKEVGERTIKNDVLFTIIDDSEIEIVFSVPDSAFSSINNIQSIEVSVPTIQTKFKADIRIISPIVDPQSGNITIKANITNPNNKLKHGMYAEVYMTTGNEYEAIFIPTQSILEKQEKTATVFKVVNDHLIKQKIELGTEQGEIVEVSKGLNSDDIVVYKLLPNLKEGTKIEAINYY